MSPDVQHRLFNYSQTPPPAAWQGIEEALDAPAYAQKLYNYEATPPVAVWQKVVQELETPHDRVIPLRTKLFKYAIAASVLAAVAAASLFYLTNSRTPKLASQPKNDEINQQSNPALNTQQGLKSESTVWEKKPDAREYDNGLVTENASTQGTIIHFSSRIRIANKQRLPMHAPTILPEGKNFVDTERADRYMIATTSSGKAVRLPKKAYSDYACANARCKEKIASIQSKMAASVTTDFTDFMDLLKKLQDN